MVCCHEVARYFLAECEISKHSNDLVYASCTADAESRNVVHSRLIVVFELIVAWEQILRAGEGKNVDWYA